MATRKKTTSKGAAPAATKAAPSTVEDKLAAQALKFIDEAASVLRTGIRTGATESHKARLAAKKKAHSLVGKAATSLSKAVDASASTLQSAISKL